MLYFETNKNLVGLLDRIVSGRDLNTRDGALGLFVCVLLQSPGLLPRFFNEFLDAQVQ